MSTLILTVDVEDWFHVEKLRRLVPPSRWPEQVLRVEASVERLLALFAEGGARATFFVLGWVAARCPDVVRRIATAGHEVASHGFGHQRLQELGPSAFEDDARRAKETLEDLTGHPVLGYRAPTFSLQPWTASILARLGFVYDSSYCPGAYRYGDLGLAPHGALVRRLGDALWEVEVPSLEMGGLEIPWGGSGYFRLYPYPLFAAGLRRIVQRRHGYVFYCHPWEVDPGQPRIAGLSWRGRLRQYHGLASTEAKLARLVRDFRFETAIAGVRRHAGGPSQENAA